ncbi:hypothetical protein ACFL6S_04165 [Candidatus Poribacteria bacterium]
MCGTEYHLFAFFCFAISSSPTFARDGEISGRNLNNQAWKDMASAMGSSIKLPVVR